MLIIVSITTLCFSNSYYLMLLGVAKFSLFWVPLIGNNIVPDYVTVEFILANLYAWGVWKVISLIWSFEPRVINV